MNSSKNNAVFRSTKERSFAERKATNGGVVLGQVLWKVGQLYRRESFLESDGTTVAPAS